MIHHDYTNFAVNILLLSEDPLLLSEDPLLLIVDALLQRGLAKVSEVMGAKNSMYKPDTPSSHHEHPQPDRRAEPRSRCC